MEVPRFPAISVLLLLWQAGVLPILAFEQPHHRELANVDRRLEAMPAVRMPPAARLQAAAALQRVEPGAAVALDEITDAPRHVAARRGYLTGPAGEGRSVTPETARRVAADDPHRPVKTFLMQHARLYGHDARVLEAARVIRDYRVGPAGLRTTVWQQELDGVPIFDALMVGHATARDELVSLSSGFIADPTEAARPGRGRMEGPLLSPAMAVQLAAEAIEEPLDAGEIEALDPQPAGAVRRQRFRAGALPALAEAMLVWLPLDGATLVLCWQVELTRRVGGERFRVVLDARTGDLWVRRCLTVYLTAASYRVFTSDSPSPFSPGHATPATNQPPLVPRSLVTLAALSTNASPIGWIHDGANETRGNNVHAHLDRNADDQPDLPRPQGAPFRVFDFPVDLEAAPAAYGAASVVQLFYWCNWMHDQLYELGFTEAAGNFQKDNFGRGGLGNDPMLADAQDGSGFNNANFTPSPDGVPGRIQMFLFNGPEPDRDGGLDAEIILHEYAHGLSTRLAGGGGGLNALQSAGLGEGWSDFYALAMLSEPGDDPDAAYAMGGYATYQFAGLMENYYFGIRRYPYSTDPTRNPLTFKDIDPLQAGPHLGIPANPINPFSPLFANEVHAQGEVWCLALWEARANLIRQHGFAAGQRLILQLVTEGLRLSPLNPNFLEARDAILLADQLLTEGANYELLWAAFAKRGLGFSARSPGSFTTVGVVEAFDLPDALLVFPERGYVASGPAGGPFDGG
ncbi:MAG TPA: M36 family metallopeptidase, partial [Methylomirabilota bacterium]|nr:M36 family metallopeptidase [Methylomirabilota bacterium]